MSASLSTAPTLGTAKELLARLVAFDNHQLKTNIPLIAFVEAYLAEHGIESRRVPDGGWPQVEPVRHHRSRDGGGIALSGHTDVVPVASQNWDTDPFHPRRATRKLFGRGTCDMKGYLACCLRHGAGPQGTRAEGAFHIAFSYDEEVGCTGVRR